VSTIEILGAQDEQIFVEFSTQQLAGLGIDRAALIAALQAQNAVSPSGSLQTGDEKLLIRVSGAFRTENDILDINFLSNGRLIRLRDIAEVRRALADPPQPLFRINAALLVFGRPFVAILGILALMGMIARNAVILIEQIETERAEGRQTWDAVVQGTLSRFRRRFPPFSDLFRLPRPCSRAQWLLRSWAACSWRRC
jgi:multidrug efflux pump subunit AcrB